MRLSFPSLFQSLVVVVSDFDQTPVDNVSLFRCWFHISWIHARVWLGPRQKTEPCGQPQSCHILGFPRSGPPELVDSGVAVPFHLQTSPSRLEPCACIGRPERDIRSRGRRPAEPIGRYTYLRSGFPTSLPICSQHSRLATELGRRKANYLCASTTMSGKFKRLCLAIV